MTRILFFTEQFWPETNAPAIHVFERARIWAAQGNQVTVITSAPNFPEGRLQEGYQNRWRQTEWIDGVRVVRVKTFMAPNRGFALRALDYLSFAVSGFFFALFEARPDVVISTSPQLLTAVAGVCLASVKQVPHVFELRDLWPASLEGVNILRQGPLLRRLEALELWCYHKSALVLAFTKSYQADLCKRGIPPEKICVVPNGTDLDLFQPRSKDPSLVRDLGLEGHFVVGYLGTLGMAHGLEVALQAAQTLQSEGVVFLLIGSGSAAQDLERIAQENSLDNVRFVARQPRASMPNYWSVCDVALVQLRDESVFRSVIPSKIFEACAMGVPILFAGPEGEASSLIRQHGMGVSLPGENPTALASQIKKWIAQPELLKTHARAAESARLCFGRDAQAKACLGVLEMAALKKTYY